jgi:Flp pilus assembly protein TadD
MRSRDMTAASVSQDEPSGGTAALLRAAIAAHQAGNRRWAESLYRLVLRAEPDQPDAHHLLGVSLMQRGCVGEALTSVQRAIALRPDVAEYHNSLGLALSADRRPNAAARALLQAIELAPDYANAYLNLAQVLLGKKYPVECEALLRIALSQHPQDARLRTVLGRALLLQNRLTEGAAELEAVLAVRPAEANALNFLGVARRLLDDVDGARAALEKAIVAEPDHVDAHVNLGQLYLEEGAFAEGWRQYEWRLKRPDYKRRFGCPCWQGERLDGKTILLWSEQGLGDTLQFVRYAPLVAARGGRVVLECRRPLHRLLRGVRDIAEVFDKGEATGFDVHVPLMSLPHIFDTRLDTIPDEVPYLPVPQPARLPTGGRCTVGLVWAGNPNHKRDHDRSRPLAEFAPLASVPGVAFYSLQLGPAASQTPPPGMFVTPLLSADGDFLDTAAAIAALDLVITVDTAPAHLAGALGRPVWVLIDAIPDWRWLHGRDDSPWYPTMRLFRREREWAHTFLRVASALRDFQSKRALESREPPSTRCHRL